jgi:hypothetical protein
VRRLRLIADTEFEEKVLSRLYRYFNGELRNSGLEACLEERAAEEPDYDGKIRGNDDDER